MTGNDATDIGFDHGLSHAAYVDAYGGDITTEPEVPPGFGELATYYLAGYADGIDAYADDTPAA
jgi:hypothetical protein